AIAVAVIAIAMPASLFGIEAGAEAFGVALLVAALEGVDRAHPAFVAVSGLAPVGRVIVVRIVLAAFVAAFLLAVAESALVSVLAGLGHAATAIVVIPILRERKRTERQQQRNCQTCHPRCASHSHLRYRMLNFPVSAPMGCSRDMACCLSTG